MDDVDYEYLLKKRNWTEIECLQIIGLGILSDSDFYKTYKTLFDDPDIRKSGDFYPLPIRSDFLNYVTKEGYCLSNGEPLYDKKRVIQWAIDNDTDPPAQIYKYYVQVMIPEQEKNKSITKSEQLIYKGLMKLCRYNFNLKYHTRSDYLKIVNNLIEHAGFDIATPKKTAQALEVALNEVSYLHFKIYKIKHLLDIRFTQDDYKDYISRVFYKKKWGELPPNDFYSTNKSWMLFVKFLISTQGFYIKEANPLDPKNKDLVSHTTVYRLLQEIESSNFSEP